MTILFVILIVIGAISGYKTWTNTFALGLDVFAQGLGANSKLGITISARCGLAARRGKTWGSKAVCWLFRNPKHCEEAITQDILRSIAALEVLFDGKEPPCFTELKKEANLTGKIR